jgi:spoIIIJ-associated protein
MHEDYINYATEKLQIILDQLGFVYSLSVNYIAGDPVSDINTEEKSLAIGHNGDNLRALEYILNNIVKHKFNNTQFITIDICGYKKDNQEKLLVLANKMADQAISQNKEVQLRPMRPGDRRIIHMSLADRKDITTNSTGQGMSRRVTISPA